MGERRLLALVRGHRMKRVLAAHARRDGVPARRTACGRSQPLPPGPSVRARRSTACTYTVQYEPAESNSGLFGGNSNWRGPIWFPVNYLIVEALQQFHHYYGDDFTVECPTGSGQYLTLDEIATDLARRLASIFLRDEHGRRPVFGEQRAVPARPALARPHPVPRVLPRRHRARRRRQPPDRLDGAGRQAAGYRGPPPSPDDAACACPSADLNRGSGYLNADRNGLRYGLTFGRTQESRGRL